jgi:hypothetical protein
VASPNPSYGHIGWVFCVAASDAGARPTDRADLRAEPVLAAALNLKSGGVCLIAGPVIFAIFRVLHGDTPAADAEAALNFVRNRPIYPAVHIFAVLAALVSLIGLLALTRSLGRPASWLMGQAAVISGTVGLAIFGVESTSEGLALPELARAASNADPSQQAELVRAARAVAAVTYGPSLVAIALLIGVPLLLFGIAMLLDEYPSWLAWAGVVIGGVTTLAAVGLFLVPSLFPGFLLYGVLASVVAQLWLMATGIVLLRRSRRPEKV